VNHLREAVEHLASRDVLIPGEWVDAEAEKIADLVATQAENAMCFYVGDPAGVCDLKSIVSSHDTPSDVCWYEFDFKADDGEHVILGIMTIHSNSNYHHIVLRRKSGRWMIRHTVGSTPDGFLINPPESKDEAMQLIAFRNVVLSSMRCTNVNKREHKPDSKLQQSRARDGKGPLFSYWTLHICGESRHTVGGIGSHNSPRLHIRRGHIREYKTGLFTWVQSCLVGNGDSGYVHKDYHVEAHAGDSVALSTQS